VNSTRNIKLVVAYDGAAYHGWQRQSAGIDTVQERLEDAAARVTGHPVTVLGASRTDTGVHAAGQVANFYTTNASIPLEGLRRAINSRLPGDIAIRSAQEVSINFHASRWAVGKTYRYRIRLSPLRTVNPVAQAWLYAKPLDDEPMRLAARRLIGTHDFRGFATSAEIRQNTVRTIYRCDVCRGDFEIVVSVEGNGFLYNMVRNIVGTLVEVARGHWEPEHVDKALASRDRRDAGPTAPAGGLTLLCVHYLPEDASVAGTGGAAAAEDQLPQ